ncbi:MAG TPA: hypothetical protein VKR21_17120 [Solirubrobacteraceae bacterium]|nr:hypothetical protein [Solirubrobacteraceae bacterium]
MPALLAEPLDALARQMAARPEPPTGGAPLIAMHLAVLVGRLMPSVGWTAAERHADGELIWTGRSHPYDESTVRKRARDFAARGGTELVARALEASVEQAVAASGAKAIAYTDMFDQVYWTKKPALAAPIASRGKRLLAATYFGLTFVRLGETAPLAYHVSWHKPASPLQDALEAVHGAPQRAAWLARNLRLHIWDRGGSGRPTVRWALARRIPYLTVMQGSTSWARYRRPPRVHTRTRVPVFVRRDVAVAGRGPPGSSPEVVVYPAHPEKGRRATKALRYRCGVHLSKPELRTLDQVYKTRWPCNENAIKALVAVGFGRNLDRGLTLTTSRGTDGRTARLQARQRALDEKIAAFHPTTIPQAIQQARPLLRQQQKCAAERAEIEALPQDRGARMNQGAELLCKNLMLLVYNRLMLLLAQTTSDEVRRMTPARVDDLLLRRGMLACPEEGATTLWVDPLPSPTERALQEELVRLLDGQALRLHGCELRLRLRDSIERARQAQPSGPARALRVFS